VTFRQKRKKKELLLLRVLFYYGVYRPPGKTRLEVPPLGDISCPSKAIKLTGTRNIFCPDSNDILPIYMSFITKLKRKPEFFSKSSNSLHHKFQLRDAQHSFKQKLPLGTMIPNLVFLRGEMILALW
jgi:hypothetical protein